MAQYRKFKFFSDTSFGYFRESLPYRVPDNLSKIDMNKLEVVLPADSPEQVFDHAKQLGAEEQEVDDYEVWG